MPTNGGMASTDLAFETLITSTAVVRIVGSTIPRTRVTMPALHGLTVSETAVSELLLGKMTRFRHSWPLSALYQMLGCAASLLWFGAWLSERVSSLQETMHQSHINRGFERPTYTLAAAQTCSTFFKKH